MCFGTRRLRLAVKPEVAALPLLWAVCMITATALVSGAVRAADDVVTIVADPTGRTQRLMGTVQQYQDGELILRRIGGGEQTITADRIVKIDTQWPEPFEQAEQLRLEGQYEDALEAYRMAFRNESRSWVRHRILADCITCYQQLGQAVAAAELFLGIARSDPKTPYYDRIPLRWQAWQPDFATEQQAMAWLEESAPAEARLIAASWLIGTRHQPKALETLAELTRSEAAQVALLADAQRWRLQSAQADAQQLARWESQIARMPAELRAGPWFIYGQTAARLGQSDVAALALMRSVILYDPPGDMAPAALLLAAQQIADAGRPQQATRLYAEVVRRYPDTRFAQEAHQRYETLAGDSLE